MAADILTMPVRAFYGAADTVISPVQSDEMIAK